MRLVVDTCVLIAAERVGQDVLDLVRQLQNITGQVKLSLSAISLVELAHGTSRARSERIRQSRLMFLEDLSSQSPVYDITAAIGARTGLLEGELLTRGVTVGLADLLIGVTALQHGHGVLTSNIRHLRAMPGLHVVEF